MYNLKLLLIINLQVKIIIVFQVCLGKPMLRAAKLLCKLSNKGLPSYSKEEVTTRDNIHSKLAAREHNICAAFIGEESKTTRSDNRDNDIVFFISYKIINKMLQIMMG